MCACVWHIIRLAGSACVRACVRHAIKPTMCVCVCGQASEAEVANGMSLVSQLDLDLKAKQKELAQLEARLQAGEASSKMTDKQMAAREKAMKQVGGGRGCRKEGEEGRKQAATHTFTQALVAGVRVRHAWDVLAPPTYTPAYCARCAIWRG